MADKILIVDDEEMVRKFLKIHLKKAGYEIIEAIDGEDAITTINKTSVSLVISDIKMPNMGGEILLDYIKLNFPHLPVIILTGFLDVNMAIEILKKGAFDYVIKPVKKDQMLLIVNKAITYKKLLERNFQLEKENKLYQKKLKEKVEEQTETIKNLLYFANNLNSLNDLDKILQAIIDIIKDVSSSKRISIMLLDEKQEYLTIAKAIGLREDIIKNTKLLIGEGIAGSVAQKGEVLMIDDAKDIKSNRSDCDFDSYLSIPLLEAPLKIHKNPIGVINITNKEGNKPYSGEEAKIVTYIADTASIAISNQQNAIKLQESYLESIKAIANAIESKDNYTSKHCSRIVELSLKISKNIEMSDNDKDILKFAAILHDVGKIGIKEAILLKPDKLTHEEYDEIKQHVKLGIEIIKPIKHLEHALPLIYHHHERYDGNGYPDGLAGEEIPLGARIIAVVDAYDAMTSDRSYRKKMSINDAITELIDNKGTQFDPQIVDYLIVVVTNLLLK